MAVATMHRSAHGLTSGDDSWRWRAACKGRWREFAGDHFREGGGDLLAARSAHICKHHCEVRAQCTKAAEAHRPIEMVQAGLYWPAITTRGRPIALPDPGCGPWCAAARGIRPIWRQQP